MATTIQHPTAAERRGMRSLARTVNSHVPVFWRDETGILRARTGRWLYVWNASEGRWNSAGKVAS